MFPQRPFPGKAGAFTLVELVIVVVIIGIIAAIAVPRMSAASDESLTGALRANLRILDSAVELYAGEHEGRMPSEESDGTTISDATVVVTRLVKKSSESGGSSGATLGPYVRCIPRNPFNSMATVRIDGPAAGVGTHGWRFNTTRRRFEADDSVGAQFTGKFAGSHTLGVAEGDAVEALSAGAAATDAE